MQTNYRLFTDRPIYANLPADDAAGSVFETLAHAALMLILVGAFLLGDQPHAASAPATATSIAPAASVLADAVPSPVPVVRSL